MRLAKLFRIMVLALLAFAAIYGGTSLMLVRSETRSAAVGGQRQGCASDDSGLQLPAGFCATIFADDIGHARHMVVAPSGVVYANTWSGVYYGNKPPHEGGFMVALQDKTGA